MTEEIVARGGGGRGTVVGLVILYAMLGAFLLDKLLEAFLPNGKTFAPLSFLLLLGAPLLLRRKELPWSWPRAVLTDRALYVRKPGEPERRYPLRELDSWDHFPSGSGPGSHRGVAIYGRDGLVVGLRPGPFGTWVRPFREAVAARLPFRARVPSPESTAASAAGQPERRRVGFYYCAVIGLCVAAFPLDQLLTLHHFNENTVTGQLADAPGLVTRGGGTRIALAFATDPPDAEPWVLYADSETEGDFADTVALRALRTGDEVVLTRSWWPSRWWRSDDGRPRRGKHLHAAGELLATGGAHDERPLGKGGWFALGIGATAFAIGVAGFAAIRGPARAGDVLLA